MRRFHSGYPLLMVLVILTITGCTGMRPPAAAVPMAVPIVQAAVTLTPAVELTPSLTPGPTVRPGDPDPMPATATLPPTEMPQPTATPTPAPTAGPARLVNGMPVEDFAVLSPATRANVRDIYARGQQLGRNPRAFSKLGDSISLTSHYLARFDQKRYELGIYGDLQPTVDHYRRSFERFGVALAASVCMPGTRSGRESPIPISVRPDEHMVACEFRLQNPSILLVRLGTNDIAPGDAFERAMRHTIEYSVANGVIPVLSTKSDRFEGDNRHNETMRALAAEYHIPLWDFDRGFNFAGSRNGRRQRSSDDVRYQRFQRSQGSHLRLSSQRSDRPVCPR
jgi:hypothetical protein